MGTEELEQGSDLEHGSQETTQDVTPQEQVEASDITDLSTLERFRFGDKEWTPDDLQKSILRQEDYTRKTQELSQQREEFEQHQYYMKHLYTDLQRVRANPELVNEFKRTYPDSFHEYLNEWTKDAKPAQAQTQVTQQDNLQANPYEQRIKEIEGKLTTFEQAAYDREVQAAEKHLESVMESNKGKYPFADPMAVLAQCQIAMESGKKVDDQAIERIFKANHTNNEKILTARYQETVKKQKAAHAQAKDAAGGGGIPGSAPAEPRTIKEATAQHLDSIGA